MDIKKIHDRLVEDRIDSNLRRNAVDGVNSLIIFNDCGDYIIISNDNADSDIVMLAKQFAQPELTKVYKLLQNEFRCEFTDVITVRCPLTSVEVSWLVDVYCVSSVDIIADPNKVVKKIRKIYDSDTKVVEKVENFISTVRVHNAEIKIDGSQVTVSQGSLRVRVHLGKDKVFWGVGNFECEIQTSDYANVVNVLFADFVNKLDFIYKHYNPSLQRTRTAKGIYFFRNGMVASVVDVFNGFWLTVDTAIADRTDLCYTDLGELLCRINEMEVFSPAQPTRGLAALRDKVKSITSYLGTSRLTVGDFLIFVVPNKEMFRICGIDREFDFDEVSDYINKCLNGKVVLDNMLHSIHSYPLLRRIAEGVSSLVNSDMYIDNGSLCFADGTVIREAGGRFEIIGSPPVASVSDAVDLVLARLCPITYLCKRLNESLEFAYISKVNNERLIVNGQTVAVRAGDKVIVAGTALTPQEAVARIINLRVNNLPYRSAVDILKE